MITLWKIWELIRDNGKIDNDQSDDNAYTFVLLIGLAVCILTFTILILGLIV